MSRIEANFHNISHNNDSASVPPSEAPKAVEAAVSPNSSTNKQDLILQKALIQAMAFDTQQAQKQIAMGDSHTFSDDFEESMDRRIDKMTPRKETAHDFIIGLGTLSTIAVAAIIFIVNSDQLLQLFDAKSTLPFGGTNSQYSNSPQSNDGAIFEEETLTYSETTTTDLAMDSEPSTYAEVATQLDTIDPNNSSISTGKDEYSQDAEVGDSQIIILGESQQFTFDLSDEQPKASSTGAQQYDSSFTVYSNFGPVKISNIFTDASNVLYADIELSNRHYENLYFTCKEARERDEWVIEPLTRSTISVVITPDTEKVYSVFLDYSDAPQNLADANQYASVEISIKR